MHIPDGFLDGKTLLLTGALSAAGLAVAARQVSRELPRNKVPLMGLGAAFVFAAQMLNFPVAGGTSGHMVGAVLIAALERRLLQGRLTPEQDKVLREYLAGQQQLDEGAILNAIRLVMSTPEYQLT